MMKVKINEHHLILKLHLCIKKTYIYCIDICTIKIFNKQHDQVDLFILLATHHTCAVFAYILNIHT